LVVVANPMKIQTQLTYMKHWMFVITNSPLFVKPLVL
jgi:hypothetical protein